MRPVAPVDSDFASSSNGRGEDRGNLFTTTSHGSRVGHLSSSRDSGTVVPDGSDGVAALWGPGAALSERTITLVDFSIEGHIYDETVCRD